MRLDSQLGSSHFELARIYLREKRYKEALAEIDATQKLDANNSSVHFVRGQVLQKLGRTEEAKLEMAAATKVSEDQRSKRQQELYGNRMPNPELKQEPQ